VLQPGASRKQIARTLKAAYAGGLLSEDTFVRRLEQLLGTRLIDPFGLIGDLTLRSPADRHHQRLTSTVIAVLRRVRMFSAAGVESRPILLGLDWSGEQRELLVGRHHACDLVLSNPSVSRRHARLFFRDGSWVLQDLGSTNGTIVNGVRVGRCQLCPGDLLVLGNTHLKVD